MRKINVEDMWISLVRHNNSGSERTEYLYRIYLKDFCEFIDATPNEIYKEWKKCESAKDMQSFLEKYKFLIVQYMDSLNEKGYAETSIQGRISSVKSFFMYMDMPFSNTIKPKGIVKFHNRDIKREEIAKVIRHTKYVRDRAYFCMMAQSGLRPVTIGQLKYKHIKEDFENGAIPCRIEVPQSITKGKYRGYYTFIGEDTAQYLKDYFDARKVLNDDSFIFTDLYDETKSASRKSISKTFHDVADKLGLVKGDYGKPKDIRLYCLRKWFRNKASPAGLDYVHYWMGHSLTMNDEHYRSFEDIEDHKKKYAEVMDNLRIFPKSESVAIKTLKEKLDSTTKTLQRYEKIFPLDELEEVEQWLGGESFPVAIGKLVTQLREKGLIS